MSDVKLTRQDEEELLKFLDDYAQKISVSDIDEIEKKLGKKLSNLRQKKKLPNFVKKMISQIKDLSKLFNSSIGSDDTRNKVIAALHYFVWAEDRFPDYIPVIGYIDDAFIISTVHKEIRKEINKIKIPKSGL